MKPRTRFDQGQIWITAANEPKRIESLETDHLINILRMVERKPVTCLSMMMSDLDRIVSDSLSSMSWSFWDPTQNIPVYELRRRISSMPSEIFRSYLNNSVLVRSIKYELSSRGVDIRCLLDLISKEV